MNDRVLCTKAVLDARKRGQSPVLPPPRWAPATSVKGVRTQVDLARTSTTSLPVFSSVRDTDFTSTSSSRQSAPSGNFQDGPSGSRIFEHTSSNTLFDDSDDDLWAQVDGEVSNQSTQNNSQIHVATTISDASKVDTFPQTFTHPDVDVRQMAELHDEIMSNLRQVFRLDSFRPNQYEAVLATLLGYDTFVLMATGGGKSLCYQLAAICQRGRAKGLTVVVTPLLALMVDQIRALESKKIDVVSFSGDQSSEEVRKIHERLFSSNKPSMLYVTPEKLDRSQGTRTLLKKLNLSHELARFIVDEAHCVSAWGRGFRESVCQEFISNLSFTPILIFLPVHCTL